MSSPDENKDAAPKAARDEAACREYCKTVTSLPTETVLEDIRQGKFLATYAVPSLTSSPERREYLHRLMEGGLVTIVMDLLKDCDGEPPIELRGEGKGGDDVDSPAMWAGLLVNVIGPPENRRYCMEVAKGLESLVKCMRDDKTRELFRSPEHWYAMYGFFVMLLNNLLQFGQETAEVLLQYDGCLDMMIQCQFWDTNRPDILEGPHAEKYLVPRLPDIKHAAMRMLYFRFAMILKQTGPEQQSRTVSDMTSEEKKQLYEIGVTPIVSEAHDPKCAVPFVLGLLELVQSSTAARDLEAKQIWYFMLGELAASECVDESVIKGVVDLGSNFASDPFDAAQLLRVLYRMINVAIPGWVPGSSQPQFQPVDSRYAVAINSGLFQMCFKMLIRFGCARDGQICDLMGPMLHAATAVAFHPKSSKAIENVQRQVEAEFLNPELQRFNGDAKCQQVLRMLAFFAKEPEPRQSGRPAANQGDGAVDGAVSCRNCSKVLEKDAVKRCSRCKTATYCSRDCQAAHWKGGHKLVCKKKTEITATQPIGRKEEDKLHEQMENVNRAAVGMFMDHTTYLLQWCAVNDADPLDCVAVMNFLAAPPSFEVQKSSDFLSTNVCGMRPGQRMHQTAKEAFAKNRSEGSITGITIIKPAAGGDLAAMTQSFPGSSLRFGSWHAALEKQKEAMAQEGWSEGLPHPIG